MDKMLMRVQKKKKKKNYNKVDEQPAAKIKKKPVKVVYISNPMKVNTSASEFRALVQELTGQDSDMPDPSRFRDDVQISVGGSHQYHHQQYEEEEEEVSLPNYEMNMNSTADHQLLPTTTTATTTTAAAITSTIAAPAARSDEMSHESDLSFETFDDDDAMLIMPQMLANKFFPSAAGAPYIV